MAAMADPGKSTKVQVRSCLTCTTRLSELCYDTHTLCEKCRGQVCGYDSFCDECRSWTKDFRRMYLKHQRTLHQKRVSKGNAKAKAKSPPVVDDAASNVSLESHVYVPVVILPLDPQSVDVDDNLSNLGNIQNIDNIVEIQSQPEIPPSPLPPPPPPPPPPPRFLTLGPLHQSLKDFMIYLINFRVVEPHHLKM